MEAEKVIIVAAISSIAIVGLLVGFAFLSFEPTSNSTHDQKPSSISDDQDLIDLSLELPDWNLLMSDNEILSLESLEGQFVLVDLMATYCTSCSSQNTYLKELYNNLAGDLEIISLTVSLSDTPTMMAEYKDSKGLSWPHGLDTNGVFSNYFNVEYIPTMVILDANGVVRWKHVGIWTTSQMTQTLSLMMP